MSKCIVKQVGLNLFFNDNVTSHVVRLVATYKDLENVNLVSGSKGIEAYNARKTFPTLVENGLVLTTGDVIIEYLDERYPAPRVMPQSPVQRAQTRQFVARFHSDILPLVDRIETNQDEEARKLLRVTLDDISAVLSHTPYFMSSELTLADLYLTAILWRLPALGISLPETTETEGMRKYMEKMFSRSFFKTTVDAARS